jgi:hypothetical protein
MARLKTKWVGAGSKRECVRWLPDRHARRVPSFVMDSTGCKTKRKVIQAFGPDVVFEKGEPVPPRLERKVA